MLANVSADAWLAAAVTLFSLFATCAFALCVAGVRAILKMVRDIDKKQGAVNDATLEKVIEVHNKVDALIVLAAYQQGKSGMPLSQINLDKTEAVGVSVPE